MSYSIVEYPPSIIALSKELTNHPNLWPLLEEYAATDWAGRVGVIAAHCGLVLDGAYVSSDIEYIARKCTEKLMHSRTSNVILLN